MEDEEVWETQRASLGGLLSVEDWLGSDGHRKDKDKSRPEPTGPGPSP